MCIFKMFLFNILRKFISLFSKIFMIKADRILFTAFNGTQYTCNPKYITEYLLKYSHKKIEYIWVLNNHYNELHTEIKTVKFMSLKYCYYYLTSRIIITNMGFKSIIEKPKNQIRIETWHGGGSYKKTDLSIIKDKFTEYKYKTVTNEIDYYVSSCKKFIENMNCAQYVAINKFLKIGMPRNDIFFDKIQKEIANRKIREKYCLNENCKIILYAPTWRDDGRVLEIKDIYEVVKYLNEISEVRCVLLCRAHYSGELVNNSYEEDFINVTDYPDIQELLCAADILITDYSSCMWDFSLMYKPCFIYATDIDQYKQERDFYTPMSEWPFPIATNTDELINNILNFNQEEYVEKVKQHHRNLGSYEDGHACERVCKLIEDIIDGKVKN